MLKATDRWTQIEFGCFLIRRDNFPSLGCQIKTNLDLDKEILFRDNCNKQNALILASACVFKNQTDVDHTSIKWLKIYQTEKKGFSFKGRGN